MNLSILLQEVEYLPSIWMEANKSRPGTKLRTRLIETTIGRCFGCLALPLRVFDGMDHGNYKNFLYEITSTCVLQCSKSVDLISYTK